ncbi:hypothetical protein [Nonomuraea sediminis]|uniref:hypothetical protein n=1 Tax=Nonomuraea sediminis TaxID=2835864 RepID=UPI001BDCC767|nr:hypothetical protein [Nonomuraea sediminis]
MSVGTAGPATSADFTLEDLDGRWRSPEPAEVFPGIYGIDDFWLHSPFWAIHFNSYKDADCTQRLFELIITGFWELLAPSTATQGARDANFSRTKVCLRLFDADVIASAPGTWTPGEWKDVSHGGCPSIDLPGVDDCPLEYDLLGMSGDRLYFGQRHHDEQGSIWTRRAPGLLSYYVTPFDGSGPGAGHGAEWGPAEWTHITSTYALSPRPEGSQP